MTYQLKFSGSAEIEFLPDENKDYVIAGEWSEISRTISDDLTSIKMAPLRLATVDESGEKVRLKTKNKNSVRIRAAVLRAHPNRKTDLHDSDLFYDEFTNRLTSNIEEVLTLLDL